MTKKKTNKKTNNQTNRQPINKTRIIKDAFMRERVATDCSGPSETLQQFKEECDINNIMKRYTQTGEWSHVAAKIPQYLDVQVKDFSEAMDMVEGASEMFMELPSDIRTRFDNDPGAFLAFAENPENLAEMAEMGLTEAPPEPIPVPPEIVPDGLSGGQNAESADSETP